MFVAPPGDGGSDDCVSNRGDLKMVDTIRELKVDELENVAGGGGGNSGGSGNSDASDGPLSSKELKSIIWGGSHGGKN